MIIEDDNGNDMNLRHEERYHADPVETKCPKNNDGPHEPDPNSLTVQHDGSDAYVDVNCKHCGRSGCVAKLDLTGQSINW